MPKIGVPIYKKIILPTEGAYVVVLTNPKADVWEEVVNVDEENAGSLMLSKLITEWNFTDETDAIAPITQENVKAALSNFDIAKINSTLGLTELFLSDAKKNSLLVSSAPAEKAPLPLNTQSSSTEKSST